MTGIVVNGESGNDMIMIWLNEQMTELKTIAERDKAKVSVVTDCESIVNLSKSVVEDRKLVLMKAEKDTEPENVTALAEMDKIIAEMDGIVANVKANSASMSTGSEALLQLMNDRTFQRIQEIEKQLLYRRFYFPGGSPKLRVAGTGKDTDEVEYDGSSANVDPFDHWDPRYLQEYITIAQQNGFHRWFIAIIADKFTPVSFTQAEEMMRQCINWTTGVIAEDGACNSTDICGVIAGLIYFDKIDAFFDEMQIGSKDMFNRRVRVINNDIIAPLVSKIANVLVQQSQANFKSKNYGWMAQDNQYAFDSAQYLTEWKELEVKYDEYRAKVWEILTNINALELCSNNVNVTGNNITIQQSMSCVQNIQEAEEKAAEAEKEENEKIEMDVGKGQAGDTVAGNTGGVEEGKAGETETGQAGSVEEGKAGSVVSEGVKQEEKTKTISITVGVVIGIVVLVGLIVGGVLLVRRQRKSMEAMLAELSDEDGTVEVKGGAVVC